MVIEALLEERVQKDFEKLNSEGVDAETRKGLVDETLKFTDRLIELKKHDADIREKQETRRIEDEARTKQMQDEKIDKWVRNGVTLLGIVTTSWLTYWGIRYSTDFEKEGTYTTIAGRGLISKILPKLK